MSALLAELLADKAAMLSQCFSLDLTLQPAVALPGPATLEEGGCASAPDPDPAQDPGADPAPPCAPPAKALPARLVLSSLPLLIDGYCPDLGRLPDLLLALGRDVEWEDEKECFKGLAQVRGFGASEGWPR